MGFLGINSRVIRRLGSRLDKNDVVGQFGAVAEGGRIRRKTLRCVYSKGLGNAFDIRYVLGIER